MGLVVARARRPGLFEGAGGRCTGRDVLGACLALAGGASGFLNSILRNPLADSLMLAFLNARRPPVGISRGFWPLRS